MAIFIEKDYWFFWADILKVPRLDENFCLINTLNFYISVMAETKEFQERGKNFLFCYFVTMDCNRSLPVVSREGNFYGVDIPQF